MVAFAAAALVAGPARADTVSMEDQLLALINGGRPGSLASHSGLRTVGRQHSRDMAAVGYWNHNGAAGRIANAPPDPYEVNGPPDDGFTGTWCENVDQEWGTTNQTIPERIYDRWKNSSEHLQCMTDGRMTVAGVGIYFDGTNYWATLELERDLTPPGRPAIGANVTHTGAAPTNPPAAAVAAPVRPSAPAATANVRTSTPSPRPAQKTAHVSVDVPATVGPLAAAAPAPPVHHAKRPLWPYAVGSFASVVVLVTLFARRRFSAR